MLCKEREEIQKRRISHRCSWPSWVFIVKSPIEKTHDNLQHWGAEAYFIARLAAEDEETLGFGGCGFLLLSHALDLLLLADSVLPLAVLLMPVGRGSLICGVR